MPSQAEAELGHRTFAWPSNGAFLTIFVANMTIMPRAS